MKIEKWNKRGWLKIFEVCIAIMLIASVLIIIINKEYVSKNDFSKKIYGVEVNVLEQVVTEYKKNQIKENNKKSINVFVDEKIPDYLDCEARICGLEDECELLENDNENLYVQLLPIIETEKQLKLFCWIK